MAALPSSLQLFCIRSVEKHRTSIHTFRISQEKSSVKLSPCALSLSSTTQLWVPRGLFRDSWSIRLWTKIRSTHHPLLKAEDTGPRATWVVPPTKDMAVTILKLQSLLFTRAVAVTQACPPLMNCAPPMALMAFAVWGLGPCLRLIRRTLFLREDRSWEKSRTYHIMASYVRPLVLWMGVILICRTFDPLVLSSDASQAIKERFVNFVRSLSTVLAFAFCTASLTQQLQKFVMERHGMEDGRKLGMQFIGNTIYTSVWVAAVCLFMELLGFSTQRWITAGGFGTVLVTLAGREIFTNFLSSIMIHATRPFVESEWIQTKIEGQDVSGTVEHVGWWSPTVIRGDDREAVHIPNHKFTVSVVRNLTQKTHWRIKAHLGISHLDFSKITWALMFEPIRGPVHFMHFHCSSDGRKKTFMQCYYIVSDMRKVLAKYPQVEHKRLHRRVFLDNIDPDNQALLILVSCFVKTSHFEEYLRVKEIILLDLLKVISHHNARLATPIRTIQRVYDESEARQAPRSGESSYRPFLLVGSSSSGDSNEAHNKGVPLRNVATAEKSSLDSEQVVSSMVNGEGSQDLKTKSKSKEKAQVVNESTSIKSALASTNNGQGSKLQLEGLDSMGLHSNDITLLGAAFEKPPAKIPEGRLNSGPSEKSSSKTPISEHGVQNQGTGGEILAGRAEKVEASEGESSADLQEVRHIPKSTMDLSLQDHRVKSNSNELHDDPWKTQGSLSTATPGSKQEDGLSYSRTASPVDIGGGTSVGRSQSVEENLVLGVALDGPKRTLPLDNKISSSTEQKDFVASRNGSGNSSKDRQESTQNKGLSSS